MKANDLPKINMTPQKGISKSINGSTKWRIARCFLLILAIPAAIALALPLLLFFFFLIFVRPILEAKPAEAHPPDDGALTSIQPVSLVAKGEPQPLRVTFELANSAICRGGSVRLTPGRILKLPGGKWKLAFQWGAGWGDFQRKSRNRPNYSAVRVWKNGVRMRPEKISIEIVNDASRKMLLRWLKRKFLQKLGIRLAPLNPKDAFLSQKGITVRFVEEEIGAGDIVEFTLGEGVGLEPPAAPIQTDFAIEVDRDGSGDFRIVSAVPTIEVTGGDPSRLEIIAPSRVFVNRPFTVIVRCIDEHGFPTPHFSGYLRVMSDEGISFPEKILLKEGEHFARIECICLKSGYFRLKARDESRELFGESNPIECRPSGNLLVWGDLHTHSLISDGTMEPSYIYNKASVELGRNFAAVADHDIWSLGEEYSRKPEEFQFMVAEADRHYVPGKFVTFPAFEWTHHHRGHRTIIFGPGESPILLSHKDNRFDTPDKLLNALKGKKAIAIPHHPAWKTHFGEMYFDWGKPDSENQRLVEVYSMHGCSEYYGCPRPISHAALIEGFRGKVYRAFLGKEYAGPATGSYVRDALAQGYKLGLCAGSDDHLVGADPRKGIGVVYRGGLTGIYAALLTRESLWEALYDRNVIATTGERIILELVINGYYQGSEVISDGPPEVRARVAGTSPFALVEVVKFDGTDYTSLYFNENAGSVMDFSIKDKRFSGYSFYYLRVIQSDGAMGWAGPIWVYKPGYRR